MKKQIILSALAAVFVVASCDSNSAENNEVEVKQETEMDTETSEVEVVEEMVNVDSLVQAIDATRARIEALELAPVEMATAELRSKLKQKWSNIHFYVENDKLVKVKTYPYAEVSKRTEEFYVNDGELVLVVIEDDGSGEKGKTKDQLDKLYYFNNAELIKELKSNSEIEFNEKYSDAEELQAEFKEYLELYNASKN